MPQQAKTALLLVDLQYLNALPDRGVFASEQSTPGGWENYSSRLNATVLPNVQGLLEAFRSANQEVLHARIQSLTADGRDRSPWHKNLGLHAAPGSREAEFLPSAAPIGDEMIFNKTASGVFASTNIEYVLRNLEISRLFVVGVFTNECVASAVRAGCDRGFDITLIEDACAAYCPDMHSASVATLQDRYCRVLTTAEAISELNRFCEPRLA